MIFIFILLHCPLSEPDLIYISLLIIPCIMYYVTNKETLNLEPFDYPQYQSSWQSGGEPLITNKKNSVFIPNQNFLIWELIIIYVLNLNEQRPLSVRFLNVNVVLYLLKRRI